MGACKHAQDASSKPHRQCQLCRRSATLACLYLTPPSILLFPPNLSRSPSWNVTDEMTRTTAGADAAQCARGRSRQLRLIRPRSLHEVRLHGLLPNHEFDRSLSVVYASGCLTPTWRSRRATSLTKIKLTLLSYSMQGTGPMAISA